MEQSTKDALQENRAIAVRFFAADAKTAAICHILWRFFGPPLQMRYIAEFHWTTAIDVAFCGVLQRHYINRHNIRVLVVLVLVITVLHKPATINIPFCSILQRRYIKLPQYISFSGISITYSGWLDDRHNRHFFAGLFLNCSGGLDHRNRPFNCPCLVQCILLLFWPKHHFGFSFPNVSHTLSLLLALRKNPHFVSLSLSLMSFAGTARNISPTVISCHHHHQQ